MYPRSLLAGTVALMTLFASLAWAEDKPAAIDPGFVPDTGQINPGRALQPPPSKPPTPFAGQAEARAALLMPDPGTISLGEAPNAEGKAQPQTTGKGITNAEGPGPIGSTMQTKPAKFSRRNDVIDHVPTMGWPLLLNDQQRQQVVQAVMSEKVAALADTQKFEPADIVPYALTSSIHPLPESVRGISDVGVLDYMKGKDKIYLVTTTTAIPIVVDVLDGK